ncbi:MAG: hypothetical protein JXA73_17610 [Acidobacteria bacterium]|nr:hypothetical protein [Acidobacteriota bacterium]
MDWKEKYIALRKYIADHAEIVINPTEISIPKELRDEFYRRFDDFRQAVIEAHRSSVSVDFDALCENYTKIEKEVVELLKVECIEIPKDLHAFVHNPREGLVRVLYTRTFDLIQGKITVEEFEQMALSDLQWATAELFRLGYEQWAALEVIKLLDPDEAFSVDLDEDFKPYPAELKTIAFGRQAHHPTMRIPEFVLHSRKLNKYVAVKMALAAEIESYAAQFKPAVRPRKKTGDTSYALDTRVMLLSFMEKADDIPVIADIFDLKRTSPDWMMEHISESELADPAGLGQVSRNLSAMNPKRGMCLVVVDAAAEPNAEALPENVRVVAPLFDESRLSAIVDTFC